LKNSLAEFAGILVEKLSFQWEEIMKMPTGINHSSSFLIPLGKEAHEIADYFCQQYSDFAKAEQVYLNTLAVYAVNLCLLSLNIATDLEASDSWNPIMQSRLTVADLVVKGKGKVECCPVMPGEDFIEISEEVLSDRIGYVFVEIDAEMSEGKVLGFLEKVNETKLSLLTLLSLDDLPAYLEKISPPQLRSQI
jgi:hypothetical protein